MTTMSSELTPALRSLIDALAEQLVRDYLTPKPAQDGISGPDRSEPVPLHPVDRAA